MNEQFNFDEIDLNILKTISGQQEVKPFECGDLFYRIGALVKHGYIEEDMCRFTNLSGNEVSVSQSYTLTQKGKMAIDRKERQIILSRCPVCRCDWLEGVQRHTGKFQAICHQCGMRSPFKNSFEDIVKWVKQEAEKEKKLGEMRYLLREI